MTLSQLPQTLLMGYETDRVWRNVAQTESERFVLPGDMKDESL